MTRTVAHVVYNFGCGGLERVLANLINHSTDYDVRHIIITLTDNQEFYSLLDREVSIFSLNKAPGNDLKSHIRLFRLLRKNRPDVMHTYNFGTLEYQITAALAGVPLRVHCEHGRNTDDPKGINPKRNLFRRCILPLLSHFVVVSPDLYTWAKDKLHISDKKLALIFNGVDLTEFSSPAVLDRPYTLCTVGRVDPIKNQAMLLDAYALAIKMHPKLTESQLLLVGDGPLLKDLKKTVCELSLQSQVKLLGYRDDIRAILQRCDVFVLSSLYEAMPMTILEAMASHLPVISTKVGGVEHMVMDNVMGLLVPSQSVSAMANAIITLFDNQTLAQEFGNNGRKLVENKYSMATMVDRYMEIYQCDNKAIDH